MTDNERLDKLDNDKEEKDRTERLAEVVRISGGTVTEDDIRELEQKRLEQQKKREE